MAQAVSQAFKDIWARRSGKEVVVEVRYRRRYFDGSFNETWETEWTTLAPSEYVAPGEISLQLDTAAPNIFKETTVTLRLNNLDGRWRRSVNDPSVFAADAVAENGYRDQGTEFQIRWLYKLDDGTFEACDLFTGYAVDFLDVPEYGVMDVPVRNTWKLRHTSSEIVDIVGAVTPEACVPPTCDGSNANFDTTSEGIIKVETVYLDGVELEPTEYTVSVPTGVSPATITLLDPLAASGKDVTWDGTKGKQGLQIEEIMAFLAEEGGYTSGNRTLDTVVYPSGLSGSQTLDSKAEWDTGTTMTNVDTARSPGALRQNWRLLDDFATGTIARWTLYIGSIAGAAGYQLDMGSTGGSGTGLAFAHARSTGSWQFKVIGVGLSAHVFFMVNNLSVLGGDWVGGSGYALYFLPGTSTVQLIRNDAGTRTVLAGWSTGSAGIWRITRDDDGVINVYKDTVLIGTATDSTYSDGAYIAVNCQSAGGSLSVDDFYYAETVDAAGAVATTFVAEYIFDLQSVPAALGRLVHSETLNGGTVTLQTATAPDSGGSPGTFEALQAIDGDGYMLSTPEQWLKIRIEGAQSSSSSLPPEVLHIVAYFTVSTVTVTLWKPTGSIWSQMQLWAKVSGYELLINASGRLIFRSRNVSASAVLHIDQNNAIVRVGNCSNGYDKVRTIGTVTFGDNTVSYTAADAGETGLTCRKLHGPVEETEDYSGVFLANDVNIALARAQGIHDARHLAKREHRTTVKLIPWLELSDPLTETYVRDGRQVAGVVAGDPLPDAGWAGPAGTAFLNAFPGKVVGMTLKPRQALADLQMEEILS